MVKKWQIVSGLIFLVVGGLQKWGWILMAPLEIPELIKAYNFLKDDFLSYALMLVGLALLYSANKDWIRKKLFGSPPDWIPLKSAVKYLLEDTKITLSTKTSPFGGHFFPSANAIQIAAWKGDLNIKGRKGGSDEFIIIEADKWNLVHFDLITLYEKEGIESGRTEIYRYLLNSDIKEFPQYEALQVDFSELKRLYPPQTKWDKSRLGQKVYHLWHQRWFYRF